MPENTSVSLIISGLLVLSASLIVVFPGWRICLLALLIFYMTLSYLLLIESGILVGLVNALVGCVVCAIGVSGAIRLRWHDLLKQNAALLHEAGAPVQRQTGRAFRLSERLRAEFIEQEGTPQVMNTLFQTIAIMMVAVIAYGIAQVAGFAGRPVMTSFAIFWLAGAGLAGLLFTRDIVKTGSALALSSGAATLLAALFVPALYSTALPFYSLTQIMIAATLAYLANRWRTTLTA